MAGVAGDICRVSLEGTIGTSIFRNVFFYRLGDPGTSTYLTGLLTEFQSTVLAVYSNAITTAYTFTELVATNLFSGDEEIDVAPTPATGSRTISGDALPYFMAALIVMERQNSRVRNGRKFIPVSLESDIAGQSFVSGTRTLMNNLASAIATTLAPGAVDEFVPCIVGRIPYTTSSGRVAYRLPATQGELGDNYSLVDSARLIDRVTTMNSRKFWRGE